MRGVARGHADRDQVSGRAQFRAQQLDHAVAEHRGVRIRAGEIGGGPVRFAHPLPAGLLRDLPGAGELPAFEPDERVVQAQRAELAERGQQPVGGERALRARGGWGGGLRPGTGLRAGAGGGNAARFAAHVLPLVLCRLSCALPKAEAIVCHRRPDRAEPVGLVPLRQRPGRPAELGPRPAPRLHRAARRPWAPAPPRLPTVAAGSRDSPGSEGQARQAEASSVRGPRLPRWRERPGAGGGGRLAGPGTPPHCPAVSRPACGTAVRAGRGGPETGPRGFSSRAGRSRWPRRRTTACRHPRRSSPSRGAGRSGGAGWCC